MTFVWLSVNYMADFFTWPFKLQRNLTQQRYGFIS